MGWAAHKKWLLIFLSKFCLRLCGDFCLLFSASSYPFGLILPPAPFYHSDSLKYIYIQTSHFVCALALVQAQYLTIIIFLLLLCSILVRSLLFLFYFNLFFCSICIRCIFFLLLPPMMVLYSIHIWFVIAAAAGAIFIPWIYSLCVYVFFFDFTMRFSTLLLFLHLFFVMIFPFFRCCCCCCVLFLFRQVKKSWTNKRNGRTNE